MRKTIVQNTPGSKCFYIAKGINVRMWGSSKYLTVLLILAEFGYGVFTAPFTHYRAEYMAIFRNPVS